MHQSQFDIEYKCEIVEHPDSGERYMCLRTRQFVFRVLEQPDMMAAMMPGDSLSLNQQRAVTIPSIEEHEEIHDHVVDAYLDKASYLNIMKEHLLARVRRRVQQYVDLKFGSHEFIDDGFGGCCACECSRHMCTVCGRDIRFAGGAHSPDGFAKCSEHLGQ